MRAQRPWRLRPAAQKLWANRELLHGRQDAKAASSFSGPWAISSDGRRARHSFSRGWAGRSWRFQGRLPNPQSFTGQPLFKSAGRPCLEPY